tara:strand:+ start:415 stop:618 length:204 start_codon:yes stop_codon:yes gene_type:complete
MIYNIPNLYNIMSYKIRKTRKKNCYSVINKQNKRIFSKCTTKKKALKQIRLLNAIKYKKYSKKNIKR